MLVHMSEGEGSKHGGKEDPKGEELMMVNRLQLLLLNNKLRIGSIKCVIGGSFGGMQATEN